MVQLQHSRKIIAVKMIDIKNQCKFKIFIFKNSKFKNQLE